MKAKIVIQIVGGRTIEIPLPGKFANKEELDNTAELFVRDHFPIGQYTQIFRMGLDCFVIDNVETIQFAEVDDETIL